MSRVWKQFAKNMALPFGMSGGYIAVSFLSGFIGELLGFAYWEAFFGVPITLSLVSLVSFLIWVEWGRARDTVNRENESLIEALKND